MANFPDEFVKFGEGVIRLALAISPRIAAGVCATVLGVAITIMLEQFAPQTRHIDIWLALSVAIGVFGMLSILYGLAQNLDPSKG